MSENILDRLGHVLTELTNLLHNLVEALREEREAIIDFNLSQIQEIYKKKNDILNRIPVLERERTETTRTLAAELGFKTVPTLSVIFEKLTDRQKAEILSDKLSCLKSLAQAAQEFNDTQKQFVAHTLAHIQNSLKFIEAMQGRASFAGYNKTGNMTDTSLVMSTTSRTA
ncbi:flagellar protein FlgN [bacterium]|nr:flagellar protein FlgN [bacterium]